jgi:flagellar biosynthesis protein FlhA
MADLGENDEHNIELIQEEVRKSIGRNVCYPYVKDNSINVITFDFESEKIISDNIFSTSYGRMLKQSIYEKVIRLLFEAIKIFENHNIKPILLCIPNNRKIIKKSTERMFPELVVLSNSEIPVDISINIIKLV